VEERTTAVIPLGTSPFHFAASALQRLKAGKLRKKGRDYEIV
jgi:hypothetical protein